MSCNRHRHAFEACGFEYDEDPRLHHKITVELETADLLIAGRACHSLFAALTLKGELAGISAIEAVDLVFAAAAADSLDEIIEKQVVTDQDRKEAAEREAMRILRRAFASDESSDHPPV